ncbi:hypothetical protein C0989_007082 [Termitomyces sp. Mn162]|nr:hypothetical protein C0989_007082 [Termitomyces sp. Mn162]
MPTPDSSNPFDLEQLAQYVLIFGQPGLENTWQRIAFNFAFWMHWQTLFGFALCQALCANSTVKTTVVKRMALVMVQPGMYQDAVAAYNAAFSDQPMVAQHGASINIHLVHVPDDVACNFSDKNALHILLHNHNLVDWVDHAYIYSMVYLKQQFHQPMLSLDIFKAIDNECIECLAQYGAPPAIPQWNEWREMSKDDHYCLMFKHDKEHILPDSLEAKDLYFFISMNPNWDCLWKQTAAHGELPPLADATNIALSKLTLVDTKTELGPSTPLRMELASSTLMANIAMGNVAMMMEFKKLPMEGAEIV